MYLLNALCIMQHRLYISKSSSTDYLYRPFADTHTHTYTQKQTHTQTHAESRNKEISINKSQHHLSEHRRHHRQKTIVINFPGFLFYLVGLKRGLSKK